MAGHETIVILDYGSQYTQLIARRVREQQVYAEIVPWTAPAETVRALAPRGFILSGGPASVYESGAPTLPSYVLEWGVPVLGICYGMQLLAQTLGGRVTPGEAREYGPATLTITAPLGPLAGLSGPQRVWMSHGDRVEQVPPGWEPLAYSEQGLLAAMGDPERRLYGVQFHPEVSHTVAGGAMLRHFLYEICGCRGDWTPGAFIEEALAEIRQQVGEAGVVCGLSGGVDSAVTALLVQRAVGEQLTCILVDTGLLRREEVAQVTALFRPLLGERLVVVEAAERFLSALAGISEPEAKRKIIGEQFIRVFEAEAGRLPNVRFLAQGTIYPDVIESAGRPTAQRIKSHHNVGGLPERMNLALVEPLRWLFKDEVRAVGLALGLPEALIWRHPFPGPGLAVRILGPVGPAQVATLQAADAIFLAELQAAGLYRQIAQAFAVLLPVHSVGVMGDGRTYAQVVALRAVTTEDFMTADWAPLPYELLARVSSRIVNEVPGVNRVVYDITSKPPATIEWE